MSRELSRLRVLFRLLVHDGLLASDPTQGLRVALEAPVLLVLSPAQVSRLLAEASRELPARRSLAVRAAIASRNRLVLELLYALGLRASELCGLRAVDVDLAEGYVRFARVKGGKAAELPLPTSVVPWVERYLLDGRPRLAGDESLAAGRLLLTERGRPLTPNHLGRILDRVAARAGVRAYPHALRRSVASHLVQGGATLPAVQHLLGHRSLNTTQRYVRLGLVDLRAAVEVLEG
ncbi:MAG: tyrosine-type recombinase/integrase [Planctomycetes bacterium]|nr:tyrosine-type recombinase/integrase [Planctomycetota bacterium]